MKNWSALLPSWAVLGSTLCRKLPEFRLVALCASGLLAACSASTGSTGAVDDGESGGSGGTVPTTGGDGGSGGKGGSVANGGTGGTGATIETGGTGGSGGSAGDMCGLQNFNLERKPAEVLLVLDRSFSMDDAPEEYVRPDGTPETARKWDLIIPALLEVVQATDAMVSWGLKVFPEGEFAGACSAGSVTPAIDVEIAEHNAQAVIERIQATNHHGDGTPTGDALRQAVTYLESRAGLNDNNRYILLATDGEPSCVNVSETSSGSEGQEAARPYAIDALTAAASAGFHTFVVGVGTNKESAVNTLEAMALAGQEPAPCANPLDPCFYLGNSQEQLAEDLRSIATAVSTCVFPLNERAPQPENIAVHVDMMKVPPDDTKVNGWSYQDDEQLIVEVYGEWCDVIKDSSSSTVEITFGCPDIVVR